MMFPSCRISPISLTLSVGSFLCAVLTVVAAEADGPKIVKNVQVYSDQANTIEFPAVDAKFVRVTIHKTNRDAAGIDELEIYGPAKAKKNLALASAGAKASASNFK